MPADGTSSASVVHKDAGDAASVRDTMVREALEQSSKKGLGLQVFGGVHNCLPYSAKVIEDSQCREKVEATILNVFRECDASVNEFNPHSEVSRFNASGVGSPHKMSKAFTDVMRVAIQVNRTSGGGFDPAIGPVWRYWRNALETTRKVPEDFDKVQELLQSSNLTCFDINLEKALITKKVATARLELSGISKGYVVDEMIRALREAGFENCFFEWAGDCKGWGRNHKGQFWQVGIVRPPELNDIHNASTRETKFIRLCELHNEALATSGDYQEVIGDTEYCHIFSVKRKALMKATNDSLAQVSVKSPSCMVADALATAAMTKESFATARHFLSLWRYVKNPCVDFTMFIRRDQLVARMHEVGQEQKAMWDQRMKMSFPARVGVIGGGLAGLSAAIEAYRCGATVVIFEKSDKLGGNSAKATSGINGWGTVPQGERGIMDGGKYFERDTYISGLGGYCNKGLVRTLSVRSGEAVDWLMKEFDLPLTVVSQLGGHSRPRTHRAPDKPDGTPVPIGYTIMQTLIEHIKAKCSDRITVLTNTPVVGLKWDNNPLPDGTARISVSGIDYKSPDGAKETLACDSIILATGGFGNDHSESSLLKEFVPDLCDVPTTNGAFSTGDGMKMARDVGAELVDMEKVQLHPTGFVNPKDPKNRTKFLGPEALRGSGGILLNTKGERFVNELDLRSTVSQAIKRQNDVYPDSDGCQFAFCVLNQAAVKLFGPNALAFYRDRIGLFKTVANVQELAQHMGAPAATVEATLVAYAKACESGQCAKTGKTVFPTVIGPEGPFEVAAVTPSIHYTMGGVFISPSAEVQTRIDDKNPFGKRRPIRGLFAAGEVTGGVHGNNRLGGNSLLECVVFGRIAGDRAATLLQRRSEALTKEWTTVTLREVRDGGDFGFGSKIFRFNCPGSTQYSGLKLGQYLGIKGEWDGRELVGYYSPITLPSDYGVIGVVARTDKGGLKDFLSALNPGDTVYMRAVGGLTIEQGPEFLSHNGRNIGRIGMVAGGTGVAPMIQIIRAALKPPYSKSVTAMSLVYAAETEEELIYKQVLTDFETVSNGRFKVEFVLNNPPQGWTGGVGFIDSEVLRQKMLRPSDDLLVILCGPPVMQRIVANTLVAQKFNPGHIHTVDGSSAAKL